jgi:hypothetical protein
LWRPTHPDQKNGLISGPRDFQSFNLGGVGQTPKFFIPSKSFPSFRIFSHSIQKRDEPFVGILSDKFFSPLRSTTQNSFPASAPSQESDFPIVFSDLFGTGRSGLGNEKSAFSG